MRNKKIKLIILIVIPAVIIAGICAWPVKKISPVVTNQKPIIEFDYNQALLNAAIYKYPKKDGEETVSGVIVPHHDIAASYSAEAFQKINAKNIKTVIIVGPNHENIGAGDIITGNLEYDFPSGQVTADDLVNQILEDKVAVSDISRLRTEHSIYNVVPFVNYYFPNAKVVPIILSGRVTKTQAETLGKYLASKLNPETIIIGSIDFSHYLSSDVARRNDLVTREALLSRDYNKLYSLNSDYLDSAPTAVTILSATSEQPEIIRNANQADIVGVSSLPSSTSYFTILFK